MRTDAIPADRRGLGLLLGWRRVGLALALSTALGLLLGLSWKSGPVSALIRVVVLGLVAMLVFGALEQWPARLPRWLARWALQVFGVGLAMPITTAIIYVLSTKPGGLPFYEVPTRLSGYMTLSTAGTLLAPWVALAALVRQKDALARHQALSFELERSELERQALDAQLRLLQAQVAPHFLFNTLANVQALVDTGSPQAAEVLRSLTAYLRAAVPRLHEPATRLGQEVELVQAYLELMHMRMPDRLQFAIHVDETALALLCPPMTLLTLVENAVRHGVDPSEEGGRIEIDVQRHAARCVVRVTDTGVGLGATGEGHGTGLSTLRQRLQLAFGGDAQLRVSGLEPQGVCAELDFPAHAVAS